VRNYSQKRKKFFCFNCFNSFLSRKALRNHKSWCLMNDNQRVEYPKTDTFVSFKSGYKASQVPFVIFYDFESLQTPVIKPCSCDDDVMAYTNADDETRMRMEHDNWLRKNYEHVDPNKLRLCPHKTKTMHVQKPFAYHIIVVSRDNEVIDTREYVGEDAGSKFCDDMLDLEEILTQQMKDVKEMELTPEDKEIISNAKNCYLCLEPLSDTDTNKNAVRDHDHLSGKFLGVAHRYCNLKRRELKKIVAFSHNFSG